MNNSPQSPQQSKTQPEVDKPTRPDQQQAGRGEIGLSDMDRSDTNRGRDFGKPELSDLGEVKGRIRQAWSKLTDSDLEGFDGNVDNLQPSIRSAYGYSNEKTSQELAQFKKTFQIP